MGPVNTPAGAPSTGLGGGRAGRTGSSALRLTYFEWSEVRIGKLQAVTPQAGEAAREPLTVAEHVKQALGFDAARTAKDQRPVLVYFHWPHDHREHGRLTETICSKVLDDEGAARWSRLFRCVQVDMGVSEKKFAELIGSTGRPEFVALDEDLAVVARIPATKSSSKLRKALEGTFKKFPEACKRLKRTLREHKKTVADAKKLEKSKEYEDALALIDPIRFGAVRVGPDWDKTYAYGITLARKVERELDGN